MANPQKENGYTAIANEILEALARIRISGEARQALDAILRKTYGYNKKEDRVALSQLCLLTSLKKQVVCRSLNKLVSMNLVIKKDTNLGNVYRFNKDFDQWKPLSKKITVLNNVNGGYSKKIKRGTQKRDIQKTITKDNNTKDIPETSSGLIVEVLKLFETVNPAVKGYYGRPPQRKACQNLIDEYGFEEVSKVIAFLPKSNKIAFLPTITTPIQLWEKYQALKDGIQRRKGELSTKGRGIA